VTSTRAKSIQISWVEIVSELNFMQTDILDTTYAAQYN